MALLSDIPIILLAAGQSSRMRGRDKLLELVDDLPLIRRQSEIARSVTQGQVIVTLPPAPHPRYNALTGCDVTLRPVARAHEGISESIKEGLAALPTDCNAAMLLLADLPDLTPQDLKKVLRSVDLDGGQLIWRGTTNTGRPGHPIVISAKLFAEMREIKGDSGGSTIMKKHRNQTVFVELPGDRARCDLDTPEDWDTWRKSGNMRREK